MEMAERVDYIHLTSSELPDGFFGLNFFANCGIFQKLFGNFWHKVSGNSVCLYTMAAPRGDEIFRLLVFRKVNYEIKVHIPCKYAGY